MVFVTGSTGYLGTHVLYELVTRHNSVRALYRNEEKLETVKRIFTFYRPDDPTLFEKIEWVKGDIGDYTLLLNCIQDVDSVYHTAGYVTFDDRKKDLLNKINVRGTSNIVNACMEAGSPKLCHVSSIATLGELAEHLFVSEEVIWNQGSSASAYAISKFKAEMEVWRGIYEGLNAVIVNPSVLIGPAMWTGPAKGLFEMARKGQRFFPEGSAGYVDVRDVARIMVLLNEGNFSGERYILNAENLEHRQLMTLLARELGKPVPDIQIKPFMARLATIIELFRSIVTGSERRISGRTFKISAEKIQFSNKKIREALSYNFIPVSESANDAAVSYNCLKA